MRRSLMTTPTLFAAAALLASSAWATAGISDLTIDDNEAQASIDLGAGVTAELTVSFEAVVGLTSESLGLSAELIDPLAVVGRLPEAVGNGVPSAFPVLITIEPPVTAGLSFSGPVTIALRTETLDYSADSTLRLFAAPVDGQFVDITGLVGAGSYRADGYKGGFSEFLVVADPRPSADVIAAKFDRLSEQLLAYTDSIPSELHDELTARLESAQTLHASGDSLGAAAEVDAFMSLVESSAGEEIPDVWRASRDVTNVAGELWASAATLRFSLRLAA